MGYTITFYASDGQVFARQLQESSEDLLEKVTQFLRDQPPNQIGSSHLTASFPMAVAARLHDLVGMVL
jgi:hypothetical protein